MSEKKRETKTNSRIEKQLRANEAELHAIEDALKNAEHAIQLKQQDLERKHAYLQNRKNLLDDFSQDLKKKEAELMRKHIVQERDIKAEQRQKKHLIHLKQTILNKERSLQAAVKGMEKQKQSNHESAGKIKQQEHILKGRERAIEDGEKLLAIRKQELTLQFMRMKKEHAKEIALKRKEILARAREIELEKAAAKKETLAMEAHGQLAEAEKAKLAEQKQRLAEQEALFKEEMAAERRKLVGSKAALRDLVRESSQEERNLKSRILALQKEVDSVMLKKGRIEKDLEAKQIKRARDEQALISREQDLLEKEESVKQLQAELLREQKAFDRTLITHEKKEGIIVNKTAELLAKEKRLEDEDRRLAREGKALQQTNSMLGKQLLEKETIVRKHDKALAQISADIDKLRALRAQEQGDLDKVHDQLLKEKDELNAIIKAHDKERQAFTAEHQEYRDAHQHKAAAEKQLAILEDKLSAVQEHLKGKSRLAEELEKNRVALEEAKNDLSITEQRVAILKTEVKEYETLRDDFLVLSRQHKKLSKERDAFDFEKRQLVARVKDLTKTESKLGPTVEKLMTEHASIDQAITTKKGYLSGLIKQIDQYESRQKALEHQYAKDLAAMDKEKEQLKRIMAEIDKREKEITALDTDLQEKNKVLAAEERRLMKRLQSLSEAVTQKEMQNEALLGSIRLKRSELVQGMDEIKEKNQLAVQKKKELDDIDAKIETGKLALKNLSDASQKREAWLLDKELKLKNREQLAEKNLTALERKIAQFRKDRDKLHDRVKELHEQLEDREREKKEQEDAMKLRVELLDKAKIELEATQKELALFKRSKDSLEHWQKTAQKQKLMLTGVLRKLSEDVEKREGEQKALLAQHSKLSTTLKALESDLKTKTHRLKDAEFSMEDTRKERKTELVRLSVMQRSLAKREAALTALERETQEKHDELQRKTRDIARIETKLERESQERAKRERDIQKSIKSLERLETRAKRRNEHKLERHSVEQEHLLEKIHQQIEDIEGDIGHAASSSLEKGYEELGHIYKVLSRENKKIVYPKIMDVHAKIRSHLKR
ncbi:MAG: hypothetical protein ABIH34_03175 [Nanoarchaeota archaeon]